MSPLFFVFFSIFICLSTYWGFWFCLVSSLFLWSPGFGFAYYLPFVCSHTWVLVLVIVFPFSDVHY
jgi:hypothetical protein